MYGSNRPTKLTKSSKKYLQPPTLTNSNLYSSSGQNQQNIQQFNELSNVEENSYFSSQNNQHQHQELRNMINHIENQNEPEIVVHEIPSQISMKKRSSLVPRLEDQQIITVQEEIDVDDIKSGEQSVILEHIDFQTEVSAEKGSSGKIGNSKEEEKREQVDLVINYVEYHEEVWGGDDNISNSTPFQPVQPDEIKVVNVRQSKNTYRERKNQIRYSLGPKIKNQSCYAKPFGRSSQSSSNNLQSNVNQIIQKWKNIRQATEGYEEQPDEEKDPRLSQGNLKIGEYNNDHHDVFGSFRESQQMIDNDVRIFRRGDGRYDVEISVGDGQNNVESLMRNMEFTQNQWHKCRAQNIKLLENIKNSQGEMLQLNALLEIKEKESLNMRKKYEQAADNQRKLLDDLRKVNRKNEELYLKFKNQEETIRQYEERNEQLSKKLEKTTRLNSSVPFTMQVSAPKVQTLNTFGKLSSGSSLDEHKECMEKIQTLQEHIFDMEQKTIGVDLEVDKRVKIIGEHIEFNLRKSIYEEYQKSMQDLKKQLDAVCDKKMQLEKQNKTLSKELKDKEYEVLQREEKVKKMYEQLVIEWKQLQKDKERYQQYHSMHSSPPKIPTYSSHLPPKPTYQSYAPRMGDGLYQRGHKNQQNLSYQSSKNFNGGGFSSNAKNNGTFMQLQSGASIPEKTKRNSSPTQLSSRTFASAIEPGGNTNLTFGRFSFGKELRSPKKNLTQIDDGQSIQLFSINSKIQKLREEINKQLDHIH